MKNKKFKISKILTGVFVFITVSLMLSLADLFSSLITVGGFTFTSDSINVSNYNLYSISLFSNNNKLVAEEQSESCKKQGGAGYVFMTDNNYNIIASIYESKADAENVKANLINSKPNTNILEIKIPNIIINCNLNTQEKEIINEAFTIFKTSYKKLYDISVSLDTSIITEINAKFSINELFSTANNVVNNFNTIYSNSNLTNFIELKIKLQDLCKTLNKLMNAESDFPYTSYIKNTYCEIVFLYKSLAESLA